MKKHLASLTPVRLYGGLGLAGLGVLILLVEIVLSHWIRQTGMNWGTLAIGLVIGYVGFALLVGRAARDQGQFLVDSTVRIIGTIRSGRRTQVISAVVEPERRIDEPPPESP